MQVAQILKDLLLHQSCSYSKEALEQAIIQITSTKNKSTSSLSRAKEGTSTYTRFSKLIHAMDIILVYLNEAIRTKKVEEE